MPLSADDVKTLSQLLDQFLLDEVLLDEGTALGPQQREPWLATLPASQRHLQAALRDLLTAPPAGAKAWALPALRLDEDPAGDSGAHVGPYRLVRQLGDGGMGSVWLAERADGRFERQVALKLPRWQAMPAGLAHRMARESHIAARLEHPHIARLYDAGVDAAQRPYLAFQYVAGTQIDTWSHEPGRSSEQVLRSFVQVVRAVAYAHRNGVVHRDLKPANMLVDHQGHATLLDFGVAKLLATVAAPTLNVTEEYGLAMTRCFASPEQVAGQSVGTASDIYSLGVTLFHLLTGQSPYAVHGDSALELDAAVLRGDTVAASARARGPRQQRSLRGDLDAILWKALQTRPEQRYPTADALADDIERHLAHQPVSVRYIPWLARVHKFTQRHRTRLAITSAVVLVLAWALGALVHQVQRTSAEAERARRVTEFTAGLFRLQALPAAAAAKATPGGLRAFEPVAALIDARFGQQPAVQADLYGGMARAYIDIGVGSLAAAAAERCISALRQSGSPAEGQAQTQAHLLLAAAHKLQGHYAQAETAARAAVAGLADGGSDAGMEARAVLAGLMLPNGRVDEARSVLAAVEAAQPTARRPASAALAKFFDAQGIVLEIDNRFDDALLLWQKAVAVATAAEGADSRTAARIRLRMAAEELGRNRPQTARVNFDAAFAALNRNGDSGRIEAALAASKFAAQAFSSGLMPSAQAESLINEARSTATAWESALPPQVVATIDVRRGMVALRQQNLGSASALLQTAVPVVLASTDGLIDQRSLVSHLGALAMARGQHAAADGWLRQRLQLRVRSGDGQTPFAAFDWVQLSHNLLMQGDAAAAEQVLAGAPVFQRLVGDASASGWAYAHAVADQRARIALVRGQPAQALAALPAPYGLEASEDRSEPTLAPFALRGEVLCGAGQWAQGLPTVLASIAALEPVLHPAAPALARLRAVAGLCALRLGDRAQATRLAALARAAFQQQPQVSPWYQGPLATLSQALGAGAPALRRPARPGPPAAARRSPALAPQ